MDTFTDGYHRLATSGERCTFFDFQMDFPDDYGVAQVPFVNVTIPYTVRKIWQRVARRMWAATPNDDYQPRQEVHFTEERFARWEKKYGQRTGSVNVEFDVKTAKWLETMMSPNLIEKIKYVRNIPHNSTFASYQVAKLSLHIYGDDCLDWYAYNSHGKRIMNGALVHRGNDEWSCHT
jgi:hypothetical protein